MQNKKIQPELEELELELKQDAIAARELDDTQNYMLMIVLMDKIEYIRQKCGYSQKELAEKAGVGLSTYKDYLSCRSDNIKLKTVIKIACALHCKPSDLIDGEF